MSAEHKSKLVFTPEQIKRFKTLCAEIKRRKACVDSDLIAIGFPAATTLDDIDIAAAAAGVPFESRLRGDYNCSDVFNEAAGQAYREHRLAAVIKAAALASVKTAARKRTHRRRQGSEPNAKPLTVKQTEAMQIVGEHKGNITAAARAMGRHPKTVKQHYKAACGKLGRKAIEPKPKTLRHARDRRGQETVSADRRRDAGL